MAEFGSVYIDKGKEVPNCFKICFRNELFKPHNKSSCLITLHILVCVSMATTLSGKAKYLFKNNLFVNKGECVLTI